MAPHAIVTGSRSFNGKSLRGAMAEWLKRQTRILTIRLVPHRHICSGFRAQVRSLLASCFFVPFSPKTVC